MYYKILKMVPNNGAENCVKNAGEIEAKIAAKIACSCTGSF